MKLLTLASLIIALLSSRPARSEEQVEARFQISGNERTRTSYITELATTCLDQSHESQITGEMQRKFFEQCLMNARLFAKVTADLSQTPIKVEIEEKWTLIPAPFFQSSGSTRRAGLVVFETNFLGQGLTLALGGNTSNKGGGFFGLFTNPAILGSKYFANISIAKESNIYELITRDETVSQAFLEKSLAGSLGFGYRFPWLNLSAQVGRVERSYDEHDNYPAPEDYSLNRAGVTLDYDKRDYKLYFSDGFFARLRLNRSFGESDGKISYQQWETSLSWQHNVVSDHALLLMANAMGYEDGRLTDSERVGSSKGFRGIETKTAWAKKYLTQTAEYQVPLKTFEKGTLTSALFLDHGQIENRGFSEVTTNYAAGGIGFYFYLSRIALPGLGLEWGVNSKYQKSFVNFSAGLAY